MLRDWYTLVSADIVARLAAEGMPALVDGVVQLGPENAPGVQTSAAPRITFVPMGGTITKRVPATPALNSDAYRASITQPWIWTDAQAWRVWIAGVQYIEGAAESSLAANWDYASAMLYVVIQSMHELMEGCWKPSRYSWEDSKTASTKLGGFGRLIALDLEVYAPVLLYNLSAPAAVATPGLPLTPASSYGTIVINESGGSGADAITITTPPIP